MEKETMTKKDQAQKRSPIKERNNIPMGEKEPEIDLDYLLRKTAEKDPELAKRLMQDQDGLFNYEKFLSQEEEKGLIHAVRACSAISMILLNYAESDEISSDEKEKTNYLAISICKRGVDYSRRQHPDTKSYSYRELSLARIYMCHGLALERMNRPYGALEYFQYALSYNGKPEDCRNEKEKIDWFLTASQSLSGCYWLLWKISNYLPQDIRLGYVCIALNTAELMRDFCPETEKFIEEVRKKQPSIYDFYKNKKFEPKPHLINDDEEKKYREWAYDFQLLLTYFSSLPFPKNWSVLLYDDLFFEFGGEQVCQHLFFEIKAIYARCRWLLYEFYRADLVKEELNKCPPKNPDGLTIQQKQFIEESYLMDYCTNGFNTDAPTEYQKLINCNVRLYSIFDKIATIIYLYRPKYFLDGLEKNSQGDESPKKVIYFKDVAKAIKKYMGEKRTNNYDDLLLLRVAEMSAEIGYYSSDIEFFFKIDSNAKKMSTIRNSVLHKGVQLVDDKDKFVAGGGLLVLSVNDLKNRTFEMIKLSREMILTTILAFEIGKREAERGVHDKK